MSHLKSTAMSFDPANQKAKLLRNTDLRDMLTKYKRTK